PPAASFGVVHSTCRRKRLRAPHKCAGLLWTRSKRWPSLTALSHDMAGISMRSSRRAGRVRSRHLLSLAAEMKLRPAAMSRHALKVQRAMKVRPAVKVHHAAKVPLATRGRPAMKAHHVRRNALKPVALRRGEVMKHHP